MPWYTDVEREDNAKYMAVLMEGMNRHRGDSAAYLKRLAAEKKMMDEDEEADRRARASKSREHADEGERLKTVGSRVAPSARHTTATESTPKSVCTNLASSSSSSKGHLPTQRTIPYTGTNNANSSAAVAVTIAVTTPPPDADTRSPRSRMGSENHDKETTQTAEQKHKGLG